MGPSNVGGFIMFLSSSNMIENPGVPRIGLILSENLSALFKLRNLLTVVIPDSLSRHESVGA